MLSLGDAVAAEGGWCWLSATRACLSRDHPRFAYGYGVTSRSRLQPCADILFWTNCRDFFKTPCQQAPDRGADDLFDRVLGSLAAWSDI